MRFTFFRRSRIYAGVTPIVPLRRVDHYKRLTVVNSKLTDLKSFQFRHAFVFPGLTFFGESFLYCGLHELGHNISHTIDGKSSQEKILCLDSRRQQLTIPYMLRVEQLAEEKFIVFDNPRREIRLGADVLIKMRRRIRHVRIKQRTAP